MARLCKGCPMAHQDTGEAIAAHITPICGEKFKSLGYAVMLLDEKGSRSRSFYWGGYNAEANPQDLEATLDACAGPKTKGWLNKTLICGAPGIKAVEESYAAEFGISPVAITNGLHKTAAQPLPGAASETLPTQLVTNNQQ